MLQQNDVKQEILIENIQNGLNMGYNPQIRQNGINGSYNLMNQQKEKIGIFKPIDEEAFSPNNPLGYIGKINQKGFRKGILSGEQAQREVIAYILDKHYHQQHEVPLTMYVKISHPQFLIPKIGSLQQFCFHNNINFNPNMFSVKQIHKVALLDIRILNCERNLDNMLFKKHLKIINNKKYQTIQIIPIHHGASLPDIIDIYQSDIYWMELPQAKQPFSQKNLDYIQSISIENDVQLIQQHFQIRSQCLINYRVVNMLLKKAAQAGLNLYEIGTLIYKNDQNDQQVSQLQSIINQSHELYLNQKNKENSIFDFFTFSSLHKFSYQNQDSRVRSHSYNQNNKTKFLVTQLAKYSSEKTDNFYVNQTIQIFTSKDNFSTDGTINNSQNSSILKHQSKQCQNSNINNNKSQYQQKKKHRNNLLDNVANFNYQQQPLKKRQSYQIQSQQNFNNNIKNLSNSLPDLNIQIQNNDIDLNENPILYDDQFYYYVSCFIDQLILKKLKDNLKLEFRQRIMSMDVVKDFKYQEFPQIINQQLYHNK